MNQPLQLAIGGIQCDTKGCDYRDDSVKVEEYPEWLNKPCPKCSGNLLTQADFDNVQLLLETAKQFNSLSQDQLRLMGINISEDDEIVKMDIGMNGTGEMDFKIKK